MPDAAAKPADLAPGDARRAAKVRHARVLIIPASAGVPGIVMLTETTSGGRLRVQEPGTGIERSLDLGLAELRALADFCNRIARRVATRPGWRP